MGSKAAVVSVYLRPEGLFLPLTAATGWDLLLSSSSGWPGSWLEEATLIAWSGSHEFTGLSCSHWGQDCGLGSRFGPKIDYPKAVGLLSLVSAE